MPRGSPWERSTRAAPVTFLLPSSGGCSAVLCRACLQGASPVPQRAAHAGLHPPQRSSSGCREQPHRGRPGPTQVRATRICGTTRLGLRWLQFLASQASFLHPQPSFSTGFCQGRANAQQPRSSAFVGDEALCKVRGHQGRGKRGEKAKVTKARGLGWSWRQQLIPQGGGTVLSSC